MGVTADVKQSHETMLTSAVTVQQPYFGWSATPTIWSALEVSSYASCPSGVHCSWSVDVATLRLLELVLEGHMAGCLVDLRSLARWHLGQDSIQITCHMDAMEHTAMLACPWIDYKWELSYVLGQIVWMPAFAFWSVLLFLAEFRATYFTAPPRARRIVRPRCFTELAAASCLRSHLFDLVRVDSEISATSACYVSPSRSAAPIVAPRVVILRSTDLWVCVFGLGGNGGPDAGPAVEGPLRAAHLALGSWPGDCSVGGQLWRVLRSRDFNDVIVRETQDHRGSAASCPARSACSVGRPLRCRPGSCACPCCRTDGSPSTPASWAGPPSSRRDDHDPGLHARGHQRGGLRQGRGEEGARGGLGGQSTRREGAEARAPALSAKDAETFGDAADAPGPWAKQADAPGKGGDAPSAPAAGRASERAPEREKEKKKRSKAEPSGPSYGRSWLLSAQDALRKASRLETPDPGMAGFRTLYFPPPAKERDRDRDRRRERRAERAAAAQGEPDEVDQAPKEDKDRERRRDRRDKAEGEAEETARAPAPPRPAAPPGARGGGPTRAAEMAERQEAPEHGGARSGDEPVAAAGGASASSPAAVFAASPATRSKAIAPHKELTSSKNYDLLDAETISALHGTLEIGGFKRRAGAREKWAKARNCLVRGRPTLLMITDWHRLVKADCCDFDASHLNVVEVADNSPSELVQSWGDAIFGMDCAPAGNMIEPFFWSQLERRRDAGADAGARCRALRNGPDKAHATVEFNEELVRPVGAGALEVGGNCASARSNRSGAQAAQSSSAIAGRLGARVVRLGFATGAVVARSTDATAKVPAGLNNFQGSRFEPIGYEGLDGGERARAHQPDRGATLPTSHGSAVAAQTVRMTIGELLIDGEVDPVFQDIAPPDYHVLDAGSDANAGPAGAAAAAGAAEPPPAAGGAGRGAQGAEAAAAGAPRPPRPLCPAGSDPRSPGDPAALRRCAPAESFSILAMLNSMRRGAGRDEHFVEHGAKLVTLPWNYAESRDAAACTLYLNSWQQPPAGNSLPPKECLNTQEMRMTHRNSQDMSAVKPKSNRQLTINDEEIDMPDPGHKVIQAGAVAVRSLTRELAKQRVDVSANLELLCTIASTTPPGGLAALAISPPAKKPLGVRDNAIGAWCDSDEEYDAWNDNRFVVEPGARTCTFTRKRNREEEFARIGAGNAPAAECSWASDLWVSPCALAISTTANACLSQTDVWGAPVPLGAAVFAVAVSFLLGILVVPAAVQATICTCLVPVRVILWGFTKSEVRPQTEQCAVRARYIALTPDEDMYEEEIDTRPVVDFKQAGPRGGLPAGLGAAKGHPVYRFTEKPKGAALQAWFDAAEGDVKLGKVYSLPDSLETPSEDFVALGRYGRIRPGRARQLGGHGQAGDERGRERGAAGFRGGAGARRACGGGPTPPAPPEDARTLAIRRDTAGRRLRDLNGVAETADNIEFEDWVLSRPRTALSVVTEISKQSGGPVQRRTIWKPENEQNDEEHIVVAHEMLSEILALACTYDQMDVSNLASMEALARHMQFIEHKKKQDTVKDFDSQGYYLGRARSAGGAIASPELLKWVAGIGRGSAVGRRANDCVAALNNLRREVDFCSKARPSEAPFSAVDMLWQAVSEDKPPGDAPSPEAALVDLLGSGSLGDGPDGPAVVRRDKTLQSDKDEHAQFLQDLLGRGVVELRAHRDFEVGVFFAWEKSGRLNQDVADCFYQFRVPDYMASRFGARPLRARQLGAKEVGGHALADGAWVYPCLRALPMGFSWATRWTLQAHRELLRRGGLGGVEGELIDQQIAPSVKSLQVEESKTNMEALVLELDVIMLRARLARAKRWRLGPEAQALLRRRRVASREVEHMIGHFTHAMLLNRPALSVFRSAYDFARMHCRAPVPLWPSARQELAHALHLLPLLTAQFDTLRSERVTCAGATLRGYAVQGADAELAGCQVRSPITNARDLLYGFLKASRASLVIVGYVAYFWSRGFINGAAWKTIHARRCHGKEAMHLEDLRAVLLGWRRKCRQAGHRRHRHLFLCDNMGMVLSGAAEERPFARGPGAPAAPAACAGPVGQSGGGPGTLDRAAAGFIDEERLVGTGGRTTLEQESIALKTRQGYERRLARFDDFCRTHGLETVSDAELEKAIAEYMDLEFSRGEPSNSGAKLLAAIGHRDPRLHHAGRLLKLPSGGPRGARAARGWRRLPLRVAGAKAREEELQATKTKGFNDSIPLVGPSRSHLGPLLEQVAHQSQPMERLFPWSGAAFNAMFKEAAALVGLASWELTPCVFRHSGPSHDWLTKARGLGAIKRRGRWASDLSGRRYEMGSRVMRRLAHLDRGRHLLLAEADWLLEGALQNGRTGNFARVLRDVGLERDLGHQK
ncbi:unnamed protein product [Prorocentrum cordatum]|uniref:Uncharacterized protein n=1 Tax=Prorocentrum cordatum TaxID=2364126 RepID=A0ABN9UDA2_9DINO|nr:unnamed protein product [Polarella glacialis]